MPVHGTSDLVDVDGNLDWETEKAWLCKIYGPGEGTKVWIPKSLGEFDGETTFTVPHWFAKKYGLI